MTNPVLTHRRARNDDLDALRNLMNAAISELQKPFLDESHIASSRTIMGPAPASVLRRPSGIRANAGALTLFRLGHSMFVIDMAMEGAQVPAADAC